MSETSLRGIGFWFNPVSPSNLPRPEAVVDHAWDPDERNAVLRHLRSGLHYETYRGWSWCRFECGADGPAMGNSELTDGVWVWPESLAHYVEVHNVALPEEFIEHAMRGTKREASTRHVCFEEWIEWGKKPAVRGSTCRIPGK